MGYDEYNREERALCFHLFRLLHEKLDSKPEDSALFVFLKKLSQKKLRLSNNQQYLDLTDLKFNNTAIYPEVALIRDKYKSLKNDASDFMDRMVKIIKVQQKVSNCRTYSDLPPFLQDYTKTHPNQIKRKAVDNGTLVNPPFSDDEKKVYGVLQAMFNAKPDLAITVDNYLIAIEAKFTQQFDDIQQKRTETIVEVWASDLLHYDLGFDKPPAYTVVKLGLPGRNADVNWDEIYQIARDYYSENDRSSIAFKNALSFK
jgi:hypothetical protein